MSSLPNYHPLLLDSLHIRRVATDEIIDLRHRVLRAGLPRESAIFSGDELPSSRHYGAFLGQDNAACLIGCASFHLNSWEQESAWQLRGMATHEDYRGRDVGRRMLDFSMRDILAASASARLFWCNARMPARGFYEAMGWKAISDVFDIPTAGPHFKMICRA